VSDARGHRDGPLGYSASILGFSDSAFTLLRDLIAAQTGVFFGAERRDQLADKLSDLVASLGMSSFLDYYYLLRYDSDRDRHWSALTDRLAVPETYFWRQPEQIRAFAQVVAPEHRAAHPGRPLRVWSAACCSGEEPISLAIALDQEGLLDRMPIEIVASDASAALVERARRGIYGERSFRSLPPELRARYFHSHGDRWRVDPRVHEQIRWTTANIVDPERVRPLAAADVIFCRNVFIYFADETITRVAQSFAEGLADDGRLFLGASESLTRLETPFELAEIGGAFVYVKGTIARDARDARQPGETRDGRAGAYSIR
jgi:chemotaxis protein methyltransferase CheR